MRTLTRARLTSLIPLLLLIFLNNCLALWEDSCERLCDEDGCSYMVNVGKIVDRIKHKIMFEWEWQGYYFVHMDDDSNNFGYGHEICVGINNCNGTYICAQVNEIYQADDRKYVELMVTGRVLVNQTEIYSAKDLPFRFSAVDTSLKMPEGIESFLIESGY